MSRLRLRLCGEVSWHMSYPASPQSVLSVSPLQLLSSSNTCTQDLTTLCRLPSECWVRYKNLDHDHDS